MEILSVVSSLNLELSDLLDFGLSASKVLVRSARDSSSSPLKSGLPESDLPRVRRLQGVLELLKDPVTSLVNEEKKAMKERKAIEERKATEERKVVAEATSVLPASVKISLQGLASALESIDIILHSPADESLREMKARGYTALSLGEALDELRIDLMHCLRTLSLAVKIHSYTLKVRAASLNKVIVDIRAAEEWRHEFGDDASFASFEDVKRILDTLFSRYGERTFNGDCHSKSFFSFLRHDSEWVSCDDCQKKLKAALVGGDAESKVSIASFAKFCGVNVMESLRNLIEEAHPKYSTDFMRVPASLHLDVPTETADPAIAETSAIVFVGQSDLLADVHYAVSTSMCTLGLLPMQAIYSVDSVAELSKWIDFNRKMVEEKSLARVMVITTCTPVEGCASSAEGCDSLAERVYDYLCEQSLFHFGFASMCCPFLTHGSEAHARLKHLLNTSKFRSTFNSCDARMLADEVAKIFQSSSSPASMSRTWPGSESESSAATRAAVTEKLGKFQTAGGKLNKDKYSKMIKK